LFYERAIGTFGELVNEAATMDADAGLRILGRYNGRPCFAFVTRFGSRYTVIICSRLRAGPGRPLASEEANGVEELKSVLKKVVHGRVSAFAY
jgi:hypothetical protein